MAPTLIRAEGVTRRYGPGAGRAVVAGVSLRVDAGEFVALIGPSGSGKSTLLALLGGLERPSAGEVDVAGLRLDRADEARLATHRREAIGFVFQTFELIPELTLRENVLLPARIAGDVGARRARAAELIASLGLADRADALPAYLSGGEQQRAAVARALLRDPPVLLADEPTGNLDSASGRAVLAALRAAAAPHRAVVVATHDPEVSALADRTVRLLDGRLVS